MNKLTLIVGELIQMLKTFPDFINLRVLLLLL